jgi:hypothetical protein
LILDKAPFLLPFHALSRLPPFPPRFSPFPFFSDILVNISSRIFAFNGASDKRCAEPCSGHPPCPLLLTGPVVLSSFYLLRPQIGLHINTKERALSDGRVAILRWVSFAFGLVLYFPLSNCLSLASTDALSFFQIPL